MKPFLILLIIFLASVSCFANEDEVLLEDSLKEPFYITASDNNVTFKEKTFKEKLNDIYHLEVEQINKTQFLLSEILTKNYSESSIWESHHLWGAYGGNIGLNFIDGEKFNGDYSFSFINLGLDGKLKNNNADYRIMFHVDPLSNRDFIQNFFADMYIATNKIPHHRLWIGNIRPPVGVEGGYSPYLLPFVFRSQIARNFGTVRKLGTRISGDYSLLDYDLGLYSSDTYFQSLFPGTEFVGWVNLKPLGKTDGKYGNLTFGGGLQSGSSNCDYTVTGAYVGYEYKNFLMNLEWADANGYNGPIGYAIDKKAGGFYSTIAYRITPKIQVLIRYDEFDTNKNVPDNNRREYVAGINYFIKGQALRFIMNYVFCQNESIKDSHKIILGTQILL